MSPYTAELLGQLERTNLSLIPLFQAVQDGVWNITGGDQEPRIEISPNLRDIVLNREKTPILSSSSTESKFSNVNPEDTVETSAFPKSQDFAETRREAEQGNVVAQFSLGNMYANGAGVPRNDAEAMRWYRKAAEQRHAAAQNNIGLMYVNGTGVSRNNIKAMEWFHKAAEQGHATALYNLGLMYANGTGVPRNDAEAMRWYRKAAEQGHAAAQNNIGLMYVNGTGVSRNNIKAVEWFHKAAEQGHATRYTTSA